jgi:glutamyl-Q tRNA(Asp) synthetase
MSKSYRGRFAPSPTGLLHFGSLVAAVGSYLDAKKNGGAWVIRMEDLDMPRVMPGAADDILRTLEVLGLQSDEAVIYQSRRTQAYEEALHRLQQAGMVYPCACSRREVADSALTGIDGQIYPGTCRRGIAEGRTARAWRVRTDMAKAIAFDDVLQGHITQCLEQEIGDFVVKRADGLFAYQLAVCVDDAFQGVTNVVRGADLLLSTPRQIWLQKLLGYVQPRYMHLPVAVNEQGEKLSKQTLAAPVNKDAPATVLLHALAFLRQDVAAEWVSYKPEEILRFAAAQWDCGRLKGVARIPAA